MSKLSKWIPFKFKRKRKRESEVDERDDGSRSVPVQVQHRGADMARLFGAPLTIFDEMDRFFGDFSPTAFRPSVDLVDEGGHIRVNAELPGLDREDVEITAQEGLLTLRGEKRGEDSREEDGCYRVERYFGSFQRAIPLPTDVDIEGAEAKFDKGLLTIRLPKLEADSPSRQIAIR